MDTSESKYLHDILRCIDNIDRFVGSPRTFRKFSSDLMMQHAVERNLEIIGEAVRSLLNMNPDIAITNARRIVDARNKIAHGYDDIEPSHIWSIIIRHLPILRSEIETLLKR